MPANSDPKNDKKKADEKKLDDPEGDKVERALDADDIKILKRYGQGPYVQKIKNIEEENKTQLEKINKLTGIKENDTDLGLPSSWNMAQDQQLSKETPLLVANCTKIIDKPPNQKYMINLKHMAKYVVKLHQDVAPTDVDEGMRVGVESMGRTFEICLPLPPKVDASVTMMTVEEKPDVTYNDIGGCTEQLEQLKEVVEVPLLNPERFIELGIDPPKGVLIYGPPGTGKTLTARAVANRTDACFIRCIGSELVQKYIGEGARLVRDLFQLARTKKACIVFFDEIDAVGGARSSEGSDNEVQRTMLEIVNQLDGFESRGAVKVLMATNRPDTLDPALTRPGRLDRKVEFALPDLAGRTQIFKINARNMAMEKNIRFELLARLCPNSTGAEIRSVCTEAGMFAIRARRKSISEKDLIKAIDKVIKEYAKFNATNRYAAYN